MQHEKLLQTGFQRWQGFGGALLCAIAVALSAYAAHATDGPPQARLQTAAVFAFGHGIAFVALAPQVRRPWTLVASLALQSGVLLFCGSLVGSVLLGWPTTLAPTGGMLLIAGWAAWAIAALRGYSGLLRRR
jgi:uncharacterized membrane protein YgdD (TMEM256/DUF423 family)